MSIAAIEELQARPQWIAWRMEKVEGRQTKVPYMATADRKASSTDPTTWLDYATAATAYKESQHSGLGFVVTAEDPYLGVDIDHCRDWNTGEINDEATWIICRLTSYTEITPSGTGVRIWIKGKLPPGARKRQGNIEIYDRARFFTVTERHLDGTPETIEERQAEFDELYAELFPPALQVVSAPSSPVDIDDEELLTKAFAARNGVDFEQLWRGDTSAYGADDSRADYALCSHLAFWTARDAVRMDRLFRASGLMRPKWDSRRGSSTYGAETITKAIASTAETYRSRLSDRGPTSVEASAALRMVRDGQRSGITDESPELAYIEPPTDSTPEDKRRAEQVQEPNLQPVDGGVGGWLVGGGELASSTTTVADLPYLPLLSNTGWCIKGWSHLLSGYPRVGKTDLMVAIVREWLDQNLVVLYLTEEPRAMWETRLAGMPGDWSGLRVGFALGIDVEELRKEARSGVEQIVVVDALRNLLQLRDETDNSEIARATNPWIGDARRADKTLLMLHHNRKGGGEYGEGIAGGHALMGGFDIVIEVLRDPSKAKNRRLLRSYARLIESKEAIYERTDAGTFRILGDPHGLELDEVSKRVRPLLIAELQTTKELHTQLGEPKPSQEQVRLALDKLARHHEIRRDPPIESGSQGGKTYRWGSLNPNLQRNLVLVGGEVEAR